MLYKKIYVRSTLSAVLLWTTPSFAQDFTDFWCALATVSNNKCYVFNPDGSPAPGLGTGEAGSLNDAMDNIFETITPLTNYSVTVSATHGTVSSLPAGISCGSQCAAYFVDKTPVTLNAVPDTGYQFKGWQGACASETTSSASLTISGNVNCSAVFEPAPKNYTVQASATHGKITSSPAKIDCGSQCAGEFAEGSTVQLTATPDTGYQFVTWQGSCSGSGSTTAALLKISQNQNCSAVFELIPVTTPPTTETPVVEKPVTDTSTVEKPAETPIVEKPVTDTSTVEKPAETPVVEKPVTDTSTVEKPAETPVVEKPVTDTSTVEKPAETPVVEKPVTDTSTVEKPAETPVVEKPAIAICAPTQPLQAVEKAVELTVGEATIIKVLGGQGRSIVKMPAAQFASVSGIEGIGESEFRIKVLPHQAGQTLLTVADCTKNEVTISLIIKPQPAKQCEVHQPIVAEQSELILMQGEGEKTVYFTGGLDDGKIQREISQFPNPAVARVTGFNRPLNNDFAVTLVPNQAGETYLKVRDCSGEASVRVIVEKPNALAIDLTGKFIPTKTYFKSTQQPDNSVQTYVHLDPKDQGKILEFIYILEKREDGAPTFFAWNSQGWQQWNGRSLANLAIGAVYSDGLATFTTAPVKLQDGAFDKLHIGYRVADTIVFHSVDLE